MKGFTEKDETFFVYDKKEDRVFSQSPDTFFYKNKLNTFYIKWEENDFLESLYTYGETAFWKSYDAIMDSTPKDSIQELDKYSLYLFLLILFWRLPHNEKIAESFVDDLFKKDSKLDYVKLIGKSWFVESWKLIDELKGQKDFKKILKLILPFYPFHKIKDWSELPTNWKFLYTEDREKWYITSDNPIISRGQEYVDVESLLNDVLFPISWDILLVWTTTGNNKEFSPWTIVDFNVAMIHNCKRFVASKSWEFLEALVKMYKTDISYGKKRDEIVSDLFNSIN